MVTCCKSKKNKGQIKICIGLSIGCVFSVKIQCVTEVNRILPIEHLIESFQTSLVYLCAVQPTQSKTKNF